MKKAFTLLELVFVILILAILSGLTLSFTGKNTHHAKLLRLKIDYEVLNSALALMRIQNELQKLPLTPNLDEAKPNIQGEKLFYCKNDEICNYSLLSVPIYSNFDTWMKIGPNQYRFFLSTKEWVDFSYDPDFAILRCLNVKYCKDLL